MKIVVIGGSGLIGSKVVARLGARGQQALAASPRSGVDAVTGRGLAEALDGAKIVVDLANSPSFESEAAMSFFENAGRNLAEAEQAAGVQHHVALSVVGTERLLDSGYFRAKMAQEALIKKSGIPYTIVRATQFFEFIGAIADSGTKDGVVRMPTAMMQPIAAEDVATAVAEVTLSTPALGIVEVAGPQPFRIDEIVRKYLAERSDPREVVAVPEAEYFGLRLSEGSLMPEAGARLGAIRFADWMRQTVARSHSVAT